MVWEVQRRRTAVQLVDLSLAGLISERTAGCIEYRRPIDLGVDLVDASDGVGGLQDQAHPPRPMCP